MPGKGHKGVPTGNPTLSGSHTPRPTGQTPGSLLNQAGTGTDGSPTLIGGSPQAAATSPLTHTISDKPASGSDGPPSAIRRSTADRFNRSPAEPQGPGAVIMGLGPYSPSDSSEELGTHMLARRDPPRTHFNRDDEYVLDDEVEADLDVTKRADGKYASRSSRKARPRNASAPSHTSAQITATTNSRPTTTAGREAQKAADVERQNRTSDFYVSQVSNRCQAMWDLMQAPPESDLIGHDAGASEADSRFNNSIAAGLLHTHIERLKKLDQEVFEYLQLWSNFENSQTTKKAAQAEADKRAQFLTQRGGYEDCKQQLLSHLTDTETQLCYAESTLEWLNSRRSHESLLPSNRATPTSMLSRVPTPAPTVADFQPAVTTTQGTSETSQTVSDPNVTQTTVVITATAPVVAPMATISAPSATMVIPTVTTATTVPLFGPVPSTSNRSDVVVTQTGSVSYVGHMGLVDAVVQSVPHAQQQVLKRVQVNPTPTAVYGTPVMTPSTTPPFSNTQTTGHLPPGMAELVMLMQQQAQQQQAMQQAVMQQQAQQQQAQLQQTQLQQHLQQQAQQDLALLQQQLQQQAQQDRALLQQQLQQQAQQQQAAMQQQAQQQQNLLLQCMKHQEESQLAIAQALSALTQAREEIPLTASTSHTFTGGAERGPTHAPNPGDTTTEGDGYHNFTSGYSTAFPAPRGGFTGRGRGATPFTPSSYAAAPHPAAQQFKLPEPEPFKGDIQDWPRFWEEWTHYITQTGPDDFSRSRLLKKLLQGPAKDITLCYRDTATDYKGLVEALEERYHRPAMVKAFLLRRLRSIEAPPRPTAAGLRQYYTQIQAVCRQLTDAGVNIDEASIRTDIHDRMNYDMISEAAKQRRVAKTEEWTLNELLQFIKEYMLTAEEIAVSHAAKRMPTDFRSPYEHKRVHMVHGESTDIFDADISPPELSDKDDKVKTKVTPLTPPAERSVTSPTPNVVLNFYGDPSKGVQGKRSGPPQLGKRFNANSNAANKTALPCIFCDTTQHRSHACDKYKTWRTRRDRLRKKPKPVCTRCLRTGHSKPAFCVKEKATLCYMKSCKGKSTQDRNHHPLLCRKTYPDPEDRKQEKSVHFLGREDDTKAESSDESATSECHSDVDEEYDYGSRPPSDMEDSDDECHTNVTQRVETVMTTGGGERTLMMVAIADVSNVSDVSKRKPCRVFFDSGSSDTLITKDQARELALPILRRTRTTFHHFGASPEGREEETWKVQFRVVFGDGTEEILEADAVDSICNPLPSLAIRPLAVAVALRSPHEAVPCSMEQPQILIGLDQMHLFQLKQRPQRLPNGFVVYDSRLGPILCGRGEVERSYLRTHKKTSFPQTINCVFRGKTVATTVQAPVRTNAVSEIVTKSLELQAIERLASLEGIGIEAPGKINEEELVLQRHKETLTRLPDGRYEVSFPFMDEILTLQRAGVPPRVILPTNYKPAVARLTSVWKSHLKDNPQGREAYSNTFDVQLTRDIIEKVDVKLFMESLTRLVHYLAHHPVFRADKPTQLRVVFDGSARSGPGTRSLNDCLHPGPSLLESLIGILLRSRGARILIIGDIEKAFLQISLREEDRDVTRFLWLKDPAKPPTPDNLEVYHYRRIPFGLNASPFLLLATIEHHLKQVDSAVSREIRQNTYSDNVFLLAHNPEEGVQKYKETKQIFSDMKMNIREFISNSPQFNDAIPEEDRAKQTKEATLGHEWDSKRDVWTFRLPEPNPFKRDLEASPPAASDELVDSTVEAEHVMVSRKVKSAKVMTKRVMLSILHGLWDPLSIFCPLTLQARLAHQELWAQEPKLKWDVPVPEAYVKLWDEATSTWSGFTCEVERHLFSEGKPASLQLHVFVDASGDGYGGVAYLRVTPLDGKTYTRLVYARNRVKCRKPVLTIPRKELLAALIGCRMVTFLRKEMLPELQRLHNLGDIPVYLWGDNQGVLYWIKDSAHVYGKFVQNRLSEIRSTADVSFRYVPTKDNPADVLSRGATTYELKRHPLWWFGAPWLAEDDKQWPDQPSDFQPFSDEIAGNDSKVVEVHVVTRKEDRQTPTPLLKRLTEVIPKVVRTYSRMRRVLTLVIRFVGRFAAKWWKRNLRLPFLAPFSPAQTINLSEAHVHLSQYKASELVLVWEAQQAYPPTPAQASQFNVETYDDGLLRCRGRLEKGKLAHDTINPIWLPERTRVAGQIIVATHLSHTHAPAETTLALIRRRFWLVKGRRNIRQAIARYCAGCRLVKGPAFRLQDYAQLPIERISKSRPFAHIGLDLFGPFLVRMGTAKPAELTQPATKRRGRKPARRNSDEEPSDLKKVWGVIFTCMATRAVHIEVTHSLSAEHLIHALDRFMCCRGHPSSVTSDNAPSIILVNRALAEMWKDTRDDPCMQDYAREHAIEWHFITPESPWQGGFYERLIRSVKHCIKSVRQTERTPRVVLGTVALRVPVVSARATARTQQRQPSRSSASGRRIRPGRRRGTHTKTVLEASMHSETHTRPRRHHSQCSRSVPRRFRERTVGQQALPIRAVAESSRTQRGDRTILIKSTRQLNS